MKLFNFRKNKKGIFNQLSSLGIGVTTFLVLIAVMFVIMAQVKSQVTSTSGGLNRAGCNTTDVTGCSAAENSTKTLIEAGATIPSWIGIIIIVAIGGMILSLLGMFGNRQ